ncbi:MAG: adenylosuccinate lyase [Muribaculaceae bacterium]|nr:adenylosuccinate lyase [Muribaculaceae bacterium]
MSNLTPLTAVSPIDGRYHSKTAALADYFSEYATIRYRIKVEVEYFIALSEVGLPQLPALSDSTKSALRRIYSPDVFTPEEAQKIKDIEKITNHDVKAVEYYLKEQFDALGLSDVKEFIHFGLTSQDINNTSFPMMVRDALVNIVLPDLDELCKVLDSMANEHASVAMLAKTHGQPASPTTLGKEEKVFAYRLSQQLELLKQVPVSGKFGGATGNFNAHRVAFPHIDWIEFGNRFLAENLGIMRESFTTQISNYDNLAALFDALKRICSIIMDLDRDMWSYISMGYFKQRIKAGEVGSSAMPHKVNPIDFENSEGNIGLAVALFDHLSHKLPVSRLQRDLTDSTVIRNIGVPVAHTIIAIASTLKGLGKLILNREAIDADLDGCWSVVAEAIQTVLRREGYPQPYEALKALTRVNTRVDGAAIATFIDSLEGISDEVRAELHTITPSNYTGYTI